MFWGEKMLENKTARQREYVATRADERERERQRECEGVSGRGPKVRKEKKRK